MLKNINQKFQFISLFLSGAAVLIFEIGGARILAPFYGSTIFVWSAMIIVTLGFLSLGYFCGGWIIDKWPRKMFFYLTIYLGSVSSLLLLKLNRPLLVMSESFGFKYGPLFAAFLLFALPIFFYSMASPALIRLNARGSERSGHNSGMVFGISTLGSLAGALLAGYYLIPSYSLASILFTSSIATACIALLGLILTRQAWWQTALAALVLVILASMPVLGSNNKGQVRIIHEEPSFYADLKVARLRFADMLLMDGAAQSVFSRNPNQSFATEAEQIDRHLNNLPENAKVLVLGFGAGSSARVFTPELSIDYVELDRKMVDLAEEYFDFKLDENDKMHIADARWFLRQTDKRYDAIFVDLYHSSVLPAHTHTKEALELMKARLKPGGVLYSNILGETSSKLSQSLARTLEEVFDNTAYSAVQEGFTNILAYATNDPYFTPDFSYKHKEIAIDSSKGLLITDDNNPLDILSSERLDNFLNSTKEVFGYQVMFAI